MKKTISFVVTLLLAFSLLAGCAVPGAKDGDGDARWSFEEIEYIRPDVEAIDAKAEELFIALQNPFAVFRVSRLLDEYYALCADFDTMYALAYIRSCHDVRDAFYAEEYRWLLETDSMLQLTTDAVYAACAESFHCGWLEMFKLWDGFSDEYAGAAEQADELYDRYMELAEREAQLLSEYRLLLSEPTIDIAGVEFSFYEYLQQPWAFDQNEAYRKYYEKYNPLLGEIYVELIALRNAMATLMGYETYALMEYQRSYSRDYSPEESEEFMLLVKEYLAPLGREISERGIYPVYESVDEQDLLRALETAAGSFGGSIEQAFRFMKQHGLYDIEVSPYKADVSFQTYLPDYESSFLFVNPYGDSADILTVFHEFGHYADSYIQYKTYESLELCESLSQTMQFLGIDKLEKTMDEEQMENLRMINMLDILDSYLYQTAYAEFELRAYQMEEPTPEKLNELSLQLAKDYGYYEQGNDMFYSCLWSDVPHFYESPFYVISYPVSASVALQIYEREQQEKGEGIKAFIQLSESETAYFMELLYQAGFDDPLSEAEMADTLELLRKEILD